MANLFPLKKMLQNGILGMKTKRKKLFKLSEIVNINHQATPNKSTSYLGVMPNGHVCAGAVPKPLSQLGDTL